MGPGASGGWLARELGLCQHSCRVIWQEAAGGRAEGPNACVTCVMGHPTALQKPLDTLRALLGQTHHTKISAVGRRLSLLTGTKRRPQPATASYWQNAVVGSALADPRAPAEAVSQADTCSNCSYPTARCFLTSQLASWTSSTPSRRWLSSTCCWACASKQLQRKDTLLTVPLYLQKCCHS